MRYLKRLLGLWLALVFCLGALAVLGEDIEACVHSGEAYANLRSEPSRDARVLARIANGSRVNVLQCDRDWWRVSFGPLEGYMYAGVLSASEGELHESPAPSPSPAPPSGGQSVFVSPFSFAADRSALTQQVGYGESLVDYQAHLSTSIAYPVTGVPALDEALVRWVRDTHAIYLSEFEDLAHANPGRDAESELTVHYSAYLTDRYVGVLEAGWYVSPFQPRSQDVLYALNADLATGELLTWENIFRPERLADVYAMVQARLGQIPESLLAGWSGAVDGSWLENAVLTDAGVALALPRGEFLPDALGTQWILLPYGELEGLLRIETPRQIAPPDPTAPPAPSALPGQRVIDPARPVIALTFDDGPSEYTQSILDLLTQYGGAATFCVVGNRVSNFEDEIRAIAAQGSEIATHTWSHKKLTTLSRSEIERQIKQAVEAVQKIADVPVRFIRPPYGSVNDKVRSVAKGLGMPVAMWSIDTEDWRTMSARKTEAAILENVKNGSIILMHDVHEPTARAMQRVIPALAERGYQLVTLSELFALREGGAQAGVVYSHLDPAKIVVAP